MKNTKGLRVGRLVLVQKLGAGPSAQWLCQCDCGNRTKVFTSSLNKAKHPTRSCGCLKAEADAARRGVERHGLGKYMNGRRHPVYSVWASMIQRCENPKATRFEDYGGRGIKVCAEWHDFARFVADVGPRPSDKHSLDRHPDVNGNYEPGNVRWATVAEQNANRRLSRTRVEVILAKYSVEAPDVIARLRKELLG